MPGANCSIAKCGTSRTHKGCSIFKLPLPNNDFNKKWRAELINVITKGREKDVSVKRQIDDNTLHICQKHFTEDQFYVYPTRKTLKEGAIPTLNLPQKSIETLSSPPRATISIKKREESLAELLSSPPSSASLVYKDIFEFKQRIVKLQLDSTWNIDIKDSFVVVTCISEKHSVPKFEIFIDNSLHFTLRVFGWMLHDDHHIYVKFDRTFFNVSLSNFIREIENCTLCVGITEPDPNIVINFQKHIIPHKFDFSAFHNNQVFTKLSQDEFNRAQNCSILIDNSSNPCSSCCKFNRKCTYESNRTQSKLNEPAKLNAPIKNTRPERLKLTIQNHRLQCKQLEEQINTMKSCILNESQPVDSELGQDFVSLFSGCKKENIPPFMKLFWEEQQKYLSNSTLSSVRYHPMIIKYCLSLAAKSSSAYSDLRYDNKTGTGILVLPSLRTLRDYKNYIRPQRGFNPAVTNELKKKTELFSDAERYVTILFDEMKIQEDLVWDKHTGELIGFVDLGDTNVNFATLSSVKELATHIFVFLVKSVVNPLSYSFATFATTSATSFQICPIFWKAVSILEHINLKVIAATCDGASPNRKFFRMHKALDGNPEKGVVYRTINLFSKDKRYIYFFADVPHLIKTTRNCFSNSGGSNRSTRWMWNSGMFILWSHISEFYYQDLDNGLKMLPKLTNDHIMLTPYSLMRVRLAAQVLSQSVGVCLNEFGPPDAAGSAKFCIMMDKFFDCLNVKNTQEHILKRKPDLKPYTSVDDIRFKWLDEFLEYFEMWKESIDERPGNFTANAKSNMFISWQTYEGLQITVNSFKEVCKYLLENGVSYVLSERFCQDDLENYFGRQRAIGSRRDNPSVRDAGYNDNTIKSQFAVRPIAGNVQARVGKFNVIDTEPLPKRTKHQ